MELRYLTRDNERVLQYRTQIQVPDYSTEKHVPKMVWTEWKDVPTVVETK
jgi:hypothetical protein